jgi:hypothetical protein
MRLQQVPAPDGAEGFPAALDNTERDVQRGTVSRITGRGPRPPLASARLGLRTAEAMRRCRVWVSHVWEVRPTRLGWPSDRPGRRRIGGAAWPGPRCEGRSCRALSLGGL